MSDYVRLEPIRMKIDAKYTEKWLQGIIANDPSVLGLGDVELLSKERRQPRAGRLDLLLADSEGRRRYEVELQLGAVDETHIVRTIEYWNIEKKRYPQYDHCAVIIAEEINARFLNVISLFNGHIPLIAMQVQAIKVKDAVTVVFTKVLDENIRAPLDEEDLQQATIDPTKWEKNYPLEIIGIMKQIHANIIRKIDSKCELNYTKHYVGITINKIANNFVLFKPKKKSLEFQVALPQIQQYDSWVESTGFDTLPYDNWFKNYRFLIRPADVDGKPEKLDQLRELVQAAYSEKVG
ncbi:hypothetical protein [Plastoroseomonas arctica]|uniref:DUF5655 domain-containing protein n=1 Tax=Plastoroseomonas arctica TaxID=1509237 RepID=A0AAF1JWV5_9PROT|nr:hypothetical protein [Plastoroseomonas arctica]MBR0655612.1 hypothetical protein [Plastoroseomonas arctica]